MAVSLFTLGLRTWSWEGASAEGIPPSVGYFESERFTPAGWKPLHGNPAFDNMTAQDSYWAARILATFTEDDLRACVETAEYSDPAATEYLVRTLVERRRKIVDYYYGKVNPLDQFELAGADDALALTFVDRGITDGAGPENGVKYRYRFGQGRGSWGRFLSLERAGSIVADSETIARLNERSRSARSDYERVFSVQIESRRSGRWGHWVRAYFHYNGIPAEARLVGVEYAS